ncbi:MAG: hypothetical protein CMK36_01265 [Porticoccaceae bacterium]|nr:hypothetical protein [Porticoccaceae bacterium]
MTKLTPRKRNKLFAALSLVALVYFLPAQSHEPLEMKRLQKSVDMLTKQLANANTKVRRLEAAMTKSRRGQNPGRMEGCDVGDARANVSLASGNRGKGNALESWLRANGKSCSPSELTQLKILAKELFYDRPALELIDVFSGSR